MHTSKPNMRDTALQLAAQGFAVFPLQANGKIPLAGSRGHLDATTDPASIRERWTDTLTGSALDYNIGISPRDGRHLILDLDEKEGREGVRDFLAFGGELAGLVVKTTTGGFHVYYSTDEGYRTGAGRIAPGIDTRGADGYVVAPGSTIDGRTYELIEDGPPLPLPRWLGAQIGTRADRDAHRMITRYTIDSDAPNNVARAAEVARRAEPAMSGVWHDYGFKLGTEMCRVGLSPEMAVTVLADHWLPRGEGFKSYERFEADVLGGYHDAERKGEHGAHSCDRQIAAFQGVTIAPAPDGACFIGQPPAPADTPTAAVDAARPPGPRWTLTRPTALHGLPVPRREFIVDQWLSPGHVTILYGDGGLGKSLLTQQLMTACAAGATWCGLPVEKCRALALACEDDDAEMHRRQASINAAMGLNFTDLGDMAWISGVGEDNTLCTFDRDDRMTLTPVFARLEHEVRSFRPRVIVCDTAADTFGGDEVRRRQVRQFVGAALGKLAKEYDAAVLLNAHPSRAGMGRGGDLDGGSTAWSNTARARWSLTRPEGRPGEVDPNERILTRRKSNYGSIGDTVLLRWQAGFLAPVTPLTGDAWVNAQLEHDAMFLRLLNKLNLSGRNVSPSKFSDIYAPKVFSLHPERDGRVRADFEAAMDRLFSMGRIRVEEGGRPSRPSKHIVSVAPRAVYTNTLQ